MLVEMASDNILLVIARLDTLKYNLYVKNILVLHAKNVNSQNLLLWIEFLNVILNVIYDSCVNNDFTYTSCL